MTILVSVVFLAAILLSAAAIIGTLASSSPQILDAIANRNGDVTGRRVIHIGQIRPSLIRHNVMQPVRSAKILSFAARNAKALPKETAQKALLPLAA
jgi:hypothetical protein